MLNKNYEQAYINSFTKIFTVLKNEYELYTSNGEYGNYEINVNKVNNIQITDYLSICFQKQNGSFTIIASNKIDNEIVEKLVKDVSLALNDNPIAEYNFKDLKGYTIYHFSYVKENIIIDNKQLLLDAIKNGEIENIKFDLIINPNIYK